MWLWACLLGFGLASVAVASFNGWHGGATVLGRYMLPFLPLALYALKELPRTAPWIALASGLGVISLFNMLAVAAVSPMAPDLAINPLYGITYRAFFEGKLSPYHFPIRLLHKQPDWSELARWTNWNWGQLIGLQGLWSLAPLVGAWLVGAGLLWHVTRTPAALTANAVSPGDA